MRRASVALLVASVTSSGVAFGAAPDTSYGRIDGDLAVAGGLGTTFGPRGSRASAEMRGRYMQTVGVFATYEDGPLLGSKAEPVRVLATGLELRPLFLARWLRGWELGSPVLDLAIDSLGLELGASFAEPEGRAFGSRAGLQAGLGIEVPLFGRATGLYLGVHGGARWSDTALAGSVAGPADRAGYLSLTLGWQQIFGAHVVDAGDRAP